MIQYYNGEYKEIAEIFRDAVHQIAKIYYTEEQVNAWCPLIINYEWWKWRCELKRPFLYWDSDIIAGFIEFDDGGHIDCHYVRSEYNRKGIGGILLRHVLNIADNLNQEKTFVEASHVAKGLYLKHGFIVVRDNEVMRRGVILNNWIMERKHPQQVVAREPGNEFSGSPRETH